MLSSYLLGAGARPTFQTFAKPSGVDNLDSALTINGTTVDPDFRYRLGDADDTNLDPWGYGDILPIVAGTVPSYNQGSPGLGASDDSAKFNEGGYYKADNNTFADITTEDHVLELVFKTDGATRSWPFAKRVGGGSYNGYALRWETDGKLYWELDVGATAVYTISAALSQETWYHVLFFVNRDEASTNGSQCYVNGLASGPGVDMSTVAATVTAAAPFTLGYKGYAGVEEYDSNIAYIAMWKQASWHQAGATGPAEWAVIAAERFAKLSGVYPQKAAGTALPSVSTRAYPAYIDKFETPNRKLYSVGSEWLRMCSREDTASEVVYGYLPETQAENLIVESEDISATWALVDAGDVIVAAAAACPDGRVVAGSIAGDATNGQHGVEISPTLTAATYTFSVFAAPDNKDWIHLVNTTVANADCYFDVANGTVGTAGAGATGYIEGPFTGGFYRCCIVLTGTAAAHTLQLLAAQADTDDTFVGDGSTKNSYFWGAQLELGDYMTSYIKTTGSALTRLADQLRYVAGANIGGEDVGQGTIACDVLLSDFSNNTNRRIVTISDGGSNADSVNLRVRFTTDDLFSNTAATAGDSGESTVATTMHNNVVRAIRSRYQSDSLIVSLDGADGNEDTAVDIADDLDRIDVGVNPGVSGQEINGLIRNFRIYKKPRKN